jgi:hypothetical protein
MSFAIKDLSALLTSDQQTVGSVMSISGDYATIATQKGNMIARVAGNVSTGDRVRLRAGWAEKAPVASSTYPV